MIRRITQLDEANRRHFGRKPTCVSTPAGFFIGDNTVKTFNCSICKKKLPQSRFYPDKNRSTGVSSRCVECKIAYESTRKRDRRDYFRRYCKNNREKITAKWKVSYAIKTGRLKKLPCEVCGKKAEAHHEDYSKPLQVKWLCHKHHLQQHRKLSFGWQVAEDRRRHSVACL